MIIFWVHRRLGGVFSELFYLDLLSQNPTDGKVAPSLTVDFLLSLKIKYKEEYEKTKGKAIGTTDSRLLHSLQVAKMSSEVNTFSTFQLQPLTYSYMIFSFLWAYFTWNY